MLYLHSKHPQPKHHIKEEMPEICMHKLVGNKLPWHKTITKRHESEKFIEYSSKTYLSDVK
jgi:hypothetical protein